MTMEARKYAIIERITDIEDENLLIKLEAIIAEYIESARKVAHLMKPMRQHLVLEELAMEQEYRGISKQVLDQIIEEVHIEEPIEDLIAMI